MQLFENASEQKLRGGYYTPPQIATFLLQWGVTNILCPDILEPSCGDGVFIEQAQNLNLDFLLLPESNMMQRKLLKLAESLFTTQMYSTEIFMNSVCLPTSVSML